MKRIEVYILLLVLLVLAACTTAPPPNAAEVALTQSAARNAACATIAAQGQPDPCNPTATPSPIPTPTLVPSATPFNHTGWGKIENDVTPMPPGFEPDCRGWIGCKPGEQYRYFINGTPVPEENGGLRSSPWWRPYLVVGGPVLLVVLVIMFLTAYGITAPQRAIAHATERMSEAFTAKLLMAPPENSETQLAMPFQADGLVHKELTRYIREFSRRNTVPSDFETVMRDQFSVYPDDQLIPVITVSQILFGYDAQRGSQVASDFGSFLEEKIQQKNRR